MKDIYKRKRAFILGNGPSINQQDLTLLRDETTFVANWFINHKRSAHQPQVLLRIVA